MLNQYMQRTQQLISDTKSEVLTPNFLASFINTARGQLAGESECIRNIGILPTVVGQQGYQFSATNIASGGVAGVDGVIHIRSIRYSVVGGATGTLWIPPRPWQWFELYEFNNAVLPTGAPATWSQYSQGASPGATGSAAGGAFFISPIPDAVYTLICDCVCYPKSLADDSDVEAIPYLWTDAVPYYAAYLTYLYTQNANAAKNMLEMYGMFVKRARGAATPSTGGWQYEQSDDPAQLSKFAKPGAA